MCRPARVYILVSAVDTIIAPNFLINMSPGTVVPQVCTLLSALTVMTSTLTSWLNVTENMTGDKNLAVRFPPIGTCFLSQWILSDNSSVWTRTRLTVFRKSFTRDKVRLLGHHLERRRTGMLRYKDRPCYENFHGTQQSRHVEIEQHVRSGRSTLQLKPKTMCTEAKLNGKIQQTRHCVRSE